MIFLWHKFMVRIVGHFIMRAGKRRTIEHLMGSRLPPIAIAFVKNPKA
jgi:hypothetical protein